MAATVIGIGRGRPRKPEAIRRLGRKRPERENPDAPQLEPVAIGEPPADLTPEQLLAWAEMAPIVTRMRVASAADLPAFRSLITSLAFARQAAQTDDLDGWAKADARWEKWCSHFGLSPAVRAKVNALGGKKKRDDPTDEFAQ